MIRICIIGVEGEHADHMTTTMRILLVVSILLNLLVDPIFEIAPKWFFISSVIGKSHKVNKVAQK